MVAFVEFPCAANCTPSCAKNWPAVMVIRCFFLFVFYLFIELGWNFVPLVVKTFGAFFFYMAERAWSH